jgi:hyperosmotically inducible periplasmic protein
MLIKVSGYRAWALVALASQLIIGMPLATYAQDQANPPSSTAPDNSSQNKKHDQTAQSQKENASDREITQKIRQSLMADKSLSTYAHNVKIITQGGQVTLKGPVQDQNEKESIATKAADVAGTGKVNNQLTVKQ